MSISGFARHDHAACIAEGLTAAQTYCAAHKLRLTPARRRVLELLLSEHRAMGAYEILERLRDEGLGRQPPVAYRALEFLVRHGFAHKVERLNAFVACAHPDPAARPHVPLFMICRTCGSVAEADTQPAAGQLARAARAAGFAIETTVYEAEGLCPDCRDAVP